MNNNTIEFYETERIHVEIQVGKETESKIEKELKDNGY